MGDKTTDRPWWRISSTRIPYCPYWYQQEVVLDLDHGAIFGEEWRAMGEIGHNLCGLYIDWLSTRTPPIKKKHGYFNHLCLKHIPGDFYPWVRPDLEDVLERFMWQFSLDIRADAHLTEINLAYKRGTFEPCDPEAACDRVTFKPDYVRVYDGGKKAAIDDWKLGYVKFDYDDIRPPLQAGMKPTRTCVQLATYANGWMKLHPECEEVTVTVIGPRWGKSNLSTYTWRREEVAEFLDGMYEMHFMRLDALWQNFGEKNWSVIPYWPSCKYCGKCDSRIVPELLVDSMALAGAQKLTVSREKKAEKHIATKMAEPAYRELTRNLIAGKITSYPPMEVKPWLRK